ncbi:MAG TPA: phage major capsid protein [Casimicrobiaceae bacterium]
MSSLYTSRWQGKNGQDLPGCLAARFLQYKANPVAGKAFLSSFDAKAWASNIAVIKGAVDPLATSTDSGALALRAVWASFVDFLAPLTLFDRVKQGAIRVPFRTVVKVGESFASGQILAEGEPMPVSIAGFDSCFLDQTKCGSLVVVSKELIRFGSTAGEQLLLGSVTRGVVKAMDTAFIMPNASGSITENCRVQSSSGTSTANLLADFSSMLQTMSDDNAMDSLVWIMSPSTAASLAVKLTPGGQVAFPDIRVNEGGSLLGVPVLTSQSADGVIVLLSKAALTYADDGVVEIAPSSEATLQLSDSPSPGATTAYSLFQNAMVGIMASRYVAWQLPHVDATVSPHQRKGAVLLSVSL